MSDEGPKVLELPVGLDAQPGETRRETDSMGAIEVPADRYWGAQTQRSLVHFSIGDDRMPVAVCQALGYVKQAAATVNGRAGRLPGWMADLIARVAGEVIDGQLDEHFPLFVWQTGSGTQSNMNVNEVISNRAIQLTGGELGSKTPVHPNDHVNLGQSSNDTFPAAMHVAAVQVVHQRLRPSVQALQQAIAAKAVELAGRGQDRPDAPAGRGAADRGPGVVRVRPPADPGHRTARRFGGGLYELAIGGTAVGTGLNAPPGFGDAVAAEIATATGEPFRSADNKFSALGGLDAMAGASAGLRGVAVPLMKIANDLRWLASGPRCGLGELILPDNEPGSSIMPGKVNPTQCEATLMVCVQVLADDNAIAMAASQGNFELNTMRPVIISNFLHSATILADACAKLREFCIEGTELNRSQIDEDVDRSLMLVTALSPVLGYDKAAEIAHRASQQGTTLREAAVDTGEISAEEFDRIMDPSAMVGDPSRLVM